MIPNLWFVTLQECREKLINCENYGYGLDKRKIKKYLPTIYKTVKRHKEEYYFYLDLYTYKLLKGEGYHPPLYLVEPRWEQEIMRDWWNCFFSYKWRGAKHERS